MTNRTPKAIKSALMELNNYYKRVVDAAIEYYKEEASKFKTRVSELKNEVAQLNEKNAEIKEQTALNKVLKGFNDLATTQQSLMNEWDYVNNLLIANPTEITELSNMSVWWICQENPDHRYKIQVKERMTYRKRNKKACSICKGYRRKQEHFVQFKKDIKK